MTTREFKQWQEKAKIYGFYGGQLNVFLSPKGFKSIKNPCDYIIKLLDNKLYDYFWFPFSKNELTIDGEYFKLPNSSRSTYDGVNVHYKHVKSLRATLHQTFK